MQPYGVDGVLAQSLGAEHPDVFFTHWSSVEGKKPREKVEVGDE